MTSYLFLCGGFGTRLEADLKLSNLDSDRKLVGVNKGLLPLLGKPLLSYWLETIDKAKAFVVCNSAHIEQFKKWAADEELEQSHLFSNGVMTNEMRNGSVKDLYLAIEHFRLYNEKVVVIAGDTLLKQFSFHQFFQDSNQVSGSVVLSYIITDLDCKKSGVLILDNSTNDTLPRVVGFLEKPNPSETESRHGCPCFYLLKPDAIATLVTFLDIYRNKGLEPIDAAGKWIEWLIHQVPVYSLMIKGRLDIGGLKSYREAEQYLKDLES